MSDKPENRANWFNIIPFVVLVVIPLTAGAAFSTTFFGTILFFLGIVLGAIGAVVLAPVKLNSSMFWAVLGILVGMIASTMPSGGAWGEWIEAHYGTRYSLWQLYHCDIELGTSCQEPWPPGESCQDNSMIPVVLSVDVPEGSCLVPCVSEIEP